MGPCPVLLGLMTLQQLPQPADHRGHLTVLLHDQDGGPFGEPHQLDGMPPYGDIGIRGGLELSIHVISAGSPESVVSFTFPRVRPTVTTWPSLPSSS